jgi:hypothetical protein
MNTSAPANYVIRIDGHLGEHCSASAKWSISPSL